MALIATMGAKKDAGIPAENSYISFTDVQGTWTPYGGQYTVGTSFAIRGYGAGAGYVNVKGHSAITITLGSTYDYKSAGGFKADGTCESIVITSGSSIDCTAYDYIGVVVGQGGQNVTANITVTA